MSKKISLKKKRLSKLERDLIYMALVHMMGNFAWNDKTKSFTAKFHYEMQPALFVILNDAVNKLMELK